MRKKKTKKEIHMQNMAKFREFFDKHKQLLDDKLTNDQNVSKLIDMAFNIYGNANFDRSKIIDDSFNIITKIIGKDIKSADWSYMIGRACMKLKGRLSQKCMDKMRAKVNDSYFTNTLLTSFYDTYCETNTIKLSDAKKLPKIKYETIENDALLKLTDDTAKAILEKVNPKMKEIQELAKCAYFITNGELTISDFYFLLNILIGEMMPVPKLDKIYDKFVKTRRLVGKYFPEMTEDYDAVYEVASFYNSNNVA